MQTNCAGQHSYGRRGFTLVELLVIIAIIGVLVALILPAVQSARESARRMQCMNNHKQIGLALQLYHDTYKVFPWAEPPQTSNNTWAWSTVIFPFMEQQTVYDQIDWNYDSNETQNSGVIKNFIPVYQCPSASRNELVSCCFQLPGLQDSAETNYVAIGTNRPKQQALAPPGELGRGVMHWEAAARMASVIDGTSLTLLVGEADMDQDDTWRTSQSAPGDLYCANLACVIGHEWRANSVVSTAWGINGDTELIFPGPNSFHPGGALFLFVDGHVGFLSETIDQRVLEGLTTYDGGEIVTVE
jgi:prepilin-type N-terminal cleavage/methylation domain-containing protein/prepilin-type processing-associated H-X9-DG protein